MRRPSKMRANGHAAFGLDHSSGHTAGESRASDRLPKYLGARTSSGVIIALLSALVTFYVSYRLSVLAADDSYIHRRIAANLVHSGYAYFNLGQRVMATSSPFWTGLLALNFYLLPHLNLIPFYEAVCTGMGCYASYLLSKQCASSWTLGKFARGVYIFLPPLLTFCLLLRSSVEQMETPFALALLIWAFYAILRERFWGISLLVLAAFTRYEFFATLLITAIALMWMRKLSKVAGGAAIAVAIACATWIYCQYHTLVPNTVRAKTAGYTISRSVTLHGLDVRPASTILLVIGLFLLAAGTIRMRRGSAPLVPSLLALTGLATAALYIFKTTYIFPWYVPVSLLPLGIGISLLGIGRRRLIFRVGTVFILSGLIAVSVKGNVIAVFAAVKGEPWRDVEDVPGLRVGEYEKIGRAIYSACPDGRLMTSEVGGLGIGFKGEILDGFGLISPAAIKYHPMKIPSERSSGELGAIPTGYVREELPDVIVSYPLYAEDVLRQKESLGYIDLTYPPLLPRDLKHLGSFYNIPAIHVLVRKDGLCSVNVIDAAIAPVFAPSS